MILLVDAGNSAVKWACCESGEPGELRRSGYFVHREQAVATQLDSAWGKLSAPQRIVVANVAGEQMALTLTQWMHERWSLSPELLQTTAEAAGVRNAYSVPRDLGIDRWAALIAAYHHYEGAVCVIDAGTAITIDMITANGQHRGGVILPGVEMLKTVLLEDTARVFASHPAPPITVAANSTTGGVQGGAVFLAVAAIERVIQEHTIAQPAGFSVVMTGGDASVLLTLLACELQHDPQLVLKGLAILAGGD